MASPRIQVVIDATAEGLRKGVAQARGALDGLDDKLSSVGKKSPFAKLDGAARELAENRLGPLGDAASLAGADLDAMSTSTLAAGAAVAGIGAFVAQGIGKLTEMTDNVRKFREVSGATWDASSRLVEVMGDLGINADQGATSMSRLAKSVDAGKLDEYGIAVSKSADGTTDLIGTLGNVADAYVATKDPAERAAMASAIFGKSWTDLTPILSRGSAGIRDLTGSVADGKIVTEEMAARQHEFKMAMDDLHDSVESLQMSMAKNLVPTLSMLAGVGGKAFDWIGVVQKADPVWITLGKISDVVDKLKGSTDKSKGSTEEATTATEELAQAQQEAAKASADLTAKKQAEARALDEAKRAADAQLGALMSLAGQELANKQAHDGFTKATQELAAATGEEYAPALDAAKEAALRAADADVELARRTAEATGGHLEARDALDVQRDSLKKLRDATGDPVLAAYLDEQIGRLDRVRDAAYAAGSGLSYMAEQARAAALAGGANVVPGFGIATPADRLERAVGGNVSAGTPYTVGEMGPELFVPQTNGRILTADDLARVGGSGGGGVTINVHSPIGRPDDVVRWISEELRRLDRSKR